jgi:hypothetical protein
VSIFPRNQSAKAGQHGPTERNPQEDVADLTDPEPPSLNRFSNPLPLK